LRIRSLAGYIIGMLESRFRKRQRYADSQRLLFWDALPNIENRPAEPQVILRLIKAVALDPMTLILSPFDIDGKTTATSSLIKEPSRLASRCLRD
jgi:hypothetical protein